MSANRPTGKKLPRRQRGRRPAFRPARVRPWLEVLERRALLSASFAVLPPQLPEALSGPPLQAVVSTPSAGEHSAPRFGDTDHASTSTQGPQLTSHGPGQGPQIESFGAGMDWDDHRGADLLFSGHGGVVFDSPGRRWELFGPHEQQGPHSHDITTHLFSLGTLISNSGPGSGGSPGSGAYGGSPAGLSVKSLTPSEGTATGKVTIATFQDGTGINASLTVRVNWGDGSPSTSASIGGSGPGGGMYASSPSIEALGNGQYAVLAGHTYAEAGPVTLSVTVQDPNSHSTANSAFYTVADPPLSNLQVNGPSAFAGVAFSSALVATFHDPSPNATPSDYKATVSWGDGGTTVVSGGGIYTSGGGNFQVYAGHTYSSANNYTVTVTVSDEGNTPFVATGAAQVTSYVPPLSNLQVLAPSATERTPTGPVTLATFQANLPEPTAGEFTARVQWGDGFVTTAYGSGGSGSAARIVAVGGGEFAVVAGHSYAEEGSNNLAVSVLWGETSVNSSAQVNVTDALGGLSVKAPAINITEGGTTGTFTVATFTDGQVAGAYGGASFAAIFGASSSSVYGGPSASEYQAVIHWGDGQNTTVPAMPSSFGAYGGRPVGFIVANGNGGYDLVASHTYAEEGSYSISVTITDETHSVSGTGSSFSVGDASLSSLSVTAPTVPLTEGKSSGPVTVATFHDNNPNATPADFRATIAWGDKQSSTIEGSPISVSASTQGGGVSASVGSIVALGNGNFAVLAGHSYAEEGSYTLAVTISDDGNASVSGTATQAVSVSDAPLSNLQVNGLTGTERVPTGLVTVATFHDTNTAAPVTDFTASIQWGDNGSAVVHGMSGLPGSQGAGIYALGNGDFAILAGHTYAEENPYTLAVRVTDHGGATTSNTGSANIGLVKLSSLQVSPPAATERVGTGLVTVATFHDANVNDTAGDMNAVIRWGDGRGTTVYGAGGSPGSMGAGIYALVQNQTRSFLTAATGE